MTGRAEYAKKEGEPNDPAHRFVMDGLGYRKLDVLAGQLLSPETTNSQRRSILVNTRRSLGENDTVFGSYWGGDAGHMTATSFGSFYIPMFPYLSHAENIARASPEIDVLVVPIIQSWSKEGYQHGFTSHRLFAGFSAEDTEVEQQLGNMCDTNELSHTTTTETIDLGRKGRAYQVYTAEIVGETPEPVSKMLIGLPPRGTSMGFTMALVRASGRTIAEANAITERWNSLRTAMTKV